MATLALGLWGRANPVPVKTDRFIVMLPATFKAVSLGEQTRPGCTKWSFLREQKSGQADYRFRVTVLDMNALPKDRTGEIVSVVMLQDYTRQLTRSFVDFRNENISKLQVGERLWWQEIWTCKSGGTSVSGSSYLTYALGECYVLVFESLSPEGETQLRDAIFASFEPRKTANQVAQPTPNGGRG